MRLRSQSYSECNLLLVYGSACSPYYSLPWRSFCERSSHTLQRGLKRRSYCSSQWLFIVSALCFCHTDHALNRVVLCFAFRVRSKKVPDRPISWPGAVPADRRGCFEARYPKIQGSGRKTSDFAVEAASADDSHLAIATSFQSGPPIWFSSESLSWRNRVRSNDWW
jgi:hypothetical protein